MTRISVIIPVYNCEKYILRLWRSLKRQTIFNELQIIFVNDGSKDGSLRILKTIEEENVTIINKENGGVSSARNAGLEIANCKYTTFIDADDYLDEKYFESLLISALEKKSDMVCAGFKNMYKDEEIIKKPRKNEIINDKNKIMESFLLGKIDPNSTDKMYIRALIGNQRFNEKYSIAEDKLFLYEYLKKCKIVTFLSVAYYNYNHENSNAATKNITNKAIMDVISIMEYIEKDVIACYPELGKCAESALIDVKCRAYCELYKKKNVKEPESEYRKIENSIKRYSIIEKMKYSSTKHFAAFILIRIHPSIYIFFKEVLRMQYK